jgi:predicted RNase H-like HicB family nuclease
MEYAHANNPKEVIAVKSYVFRVELEEEDDGRWSAWIDALPGCAVWGYTREEALEALKDAAQAYLEVMVEKGQRIPVADTVETIDAPVVAVTL